MTEPSEVAVETLPADGIGTHEQATNIPEASTGSQVEEDTHTSNSLESDSQSETTDEIHSTINLETDQESPPETESNETPDDSGQTGEEA